MYIAKENQRAAAEFIGGRLWEDMKRALRARCPSSPDTKDASHVAAAKGHQRAGFEKCIEEMEKLPIESPAENVNPFNRPAVTVTED